MHEEHVQPGPAGEEFGLGAAHGLFDLAPFQLMHHQQVVPFTSLEDAVDESATDHQATHRNIVAPADLFGAVEHAVRGIESGEDLVILVQVELFDHVRGCLLHAGGHHIEQGDFESTASSKDLEGAGEGAKAHLGSVQGDQHFQSHGGAEGTVPDNVLVWSRASDLTERPAP